MTKLKLTEVHDPRFKIGKGQTEPGQASWAGEGPKDKTCRQCNFYTFSGYWSPSSKKKAHGLKDGRCEKFAQLTVGRKGVKFSHAASTCRFFELNPAPPSSRDPKSGYQQ